MGVGIGGGNSTNSSNSSTPTPTPTQDPMYDKLRLLNGQSTWPRSQWYSGPTGDVTSLAVDSPQSTPCGQPDMAKKDLTVKAKVILGAMKVKSSSSEARHKGRVAPDAKMLDLRCCQGWEMKELEKSGDLYQRHRHRRIFDPSPPPSLLPPTSPSLPLLPLLRPPSYSTLTPPSFLNHPSSPAPLLLLFTPPHSHPHPPALPPTSSPHQPLHLASSDIFLNFFFFLSSRFVAMSKVSKGGETTPTVKDFDLKCLCETPAIALCCARLRAEIKLINVCL
ncbi:hypothetical protein C7M84_009734 [Penaeus vannamei]|uniref:Uncharacterized protein n=1 Tax=Penaeus vannamei TaxID=6689 RepID=A0A3R7M4S3_PENVA|nr:hypothetical protein C7M84_009734 [Penaeus vannamei]